MAPSDQIGFIERLSAAARAVDATLEQRLAQQSSGTPERLLAAMRHAVMAGGKRFRPFLVLETARLFGGPGAERAALEVAAALECVHAYSLVHDDLPSMDNDEMRRGQPTVWKAYDEWTAVLAGDALLTLAFEILADAASGPHPPLTPSVAVRLVAKMAAAAGPAGMVGGQVLDLEAEKLQRPARPDAAHVRRLQAMKTGALITFACEAGAWAAGADAAGLRAARGYGEAVGLAFQISDDLLDVTGSAATVGKAVGKDLALGKATLVAVVGEAAARRHLDDAVAAAMTALAPYGPAAAALREAAMFQIGRES